MAELIPTAGELTPVAMHLLEYNVPSGEGEYYEDPNLRSDLIKRFPELTPILHAPRFLIQNMGGELPFVQQDSLLKNRYRTTLSVKIGDGEGAEEAILKFADNAQIEKNDLVFENLLREHQNLTRITSLPINSPISHGFVIINNPRIQTIGLLMSKLPGISIENLRPFYPNKKYPSKIPIGVIREVVRQTTHTLKIIEQAGLLYTDLKPAQIILETPNNTLNDVTGPGVVSHLTDFGELTDLDDPRAMVHTPAYSPPELSALHYNQKIPENTVATLHTYQLAKLLADLLGLVRQPGIIQTFTLSNPELAKVLNNASSNTISNRYTNLDDLSQLLLAQLQEDPTE